MIHNAQFYASYIGKVFLWQLDILESGIFKKLLPSFEQIGKEAETACQSEYDRLGNLPGTDEIDIDDLAEQAQDAGIAYFEAMTSVQQIVLNSMVVTLFHLLEQQLIAFCSNELIKPTDSSNRPLTIKQAFARIKELLGIECRQFSIFPKIDELRLVADTVKHADDGAASSKLYLVRPDMFVAPCIRGEEIKMFSEKLPTRLPLAGQDFFVTPQDLREYFRVAREFWNTMVVQLKTKAPIQP